MGRQHDHRRLVSSSSNVTLHVRDLVAAKSWYREMLGLDEVLFESRYIAVLDLGGPGSLMLKAPGPGTDLADVANCAAFYTQDISATYRTLTERGARASAIATTGTARFFSIEDLDGNPLRIWTLPEVTPP